MVSGAASASAKPTSTRGFRGLRMPADTAGSAQLLDDRLRSAHGAAHHRALGEQMINEIGSVDGANAVSWLKPILASRRAAVAREDVLVTEGTKPFENAPVIRTEGTCRLSDRSYRPQTQVGRELPATPRRARRPRAPATADGASREIRSSFLRRRACEHPPRPESRCAQAGPRARRMSRGDRAEGEPATRS